MLKKKYVHRRAPRKELLIITGFAEEKAFFKNSICARIWGWFHHFFRNGWMVILLYYKVGRDLMGVRKCFFLDLVCETDIQRKMLCTLVFSRYFLPQFPSRKIHFALWHNAYGHKYQSETQVSQNSTYPYYMQHTIFSVLTSSTLAHAGFHLLNGIQEPVTAIDSSECGSGAPGGNKA